MSSVNSMWYEKKEDALKLIEHLLDENTTNENHFNEIKIYNDEPTAFIVEWVQVPWSKDYGGNFEFVDENQIIMTEYVLPDNSTVMLLNDVDFNDYLNMWLKENPGWEKSSYGVWHNTNEEAIV